MSRGGEGIRSSFQFIQDGRVIVCLFVGGRPGCPYQGLDVSRSLPRVINSFRLLKSVANRGKSSGDHVNALLLLQSFQFVFKKLNSIVRLRVTQNMKYILTSFKHLYVINFGPKAEPKDPGTSICQIQNGRLGRITITFGKYKTGSQSETVPDRIYDQYRLPEPSGPRPQTQ